MSFEDLEFNFFLAGELEIISGGKISDKEKKGRIELLKKISYFYELYEWKGIKSYMHSSTNVLYISINSLYFSIMII
jgi:hypothetical protein